MKILCYFPAEHPYETNIEIDDNEVVRTLIREIHKQLVTDWEYDVKLKELELYKTDLLIEPDEDLQARVLRWLQSQKEPLKPLKRLLKIFPDQPASECLHIIIATPEVKELLDGIGDPDSVRHRKVKKELNQQLNKLSSFPTPSDVVKTAQGVANFLTSEDQSVCLDQIPAAMFSPQLAGLQRALDNLEGVDVGQKEVIDASSLLGASVQFHDDDDKRQKAIKPLINALLQSNGQWGQKLDWAGSIIPDAHWFYGKTDFPIAILELKNTVGLGGDPFIQAVAVYSKIVSAEKFVPFRGSYNFPAVLLGVSGARIDIGATVCAGSVYVSRLLTLDMSSGFRLADNIIRVARVFKCLSSCLANLETYYSNKVSDRNLTTPISGLFPDPTLIPSLYGCPPPPTPIFRICGDPPPALNYRGRLSPSGQLELYTVPRLQSRTTALYVADATINGIVLPVIVKFTRRYNAKAHKLVFDAGFAPKLYSCRLIVGGVYMVIMEYLEHAVSVWQMQHEEPKQFPAASVLEDVEKALKVLHNQGLVYGDLRCANVLCSAEQHGKIVDFDWAGEDGVDKYPASLNSDRQWHVDVLAHAVMKKEHDLHVLGQLKTELVQCT